MLDTETDLEQITIKCQVPTEHKKEPVDIVIVSYGPHQFSEALCQHASKDNYNTTCVLTKKCCGYSSYNKNR